MPVCFNPPCSHSFKTLISPGASATGPSRSTDYRRSGVCVYSVSYTVLLVRVVVVVLDLPPWAVDEEGIVCVVWAVDEEGIVWCVVCVCVCVWGGGAWVVCVCGVGVVCVCVCVWSWVVGVDFSDTILIMISLSLSLSPLQSTSPNWDSPNMWSTNTAPFYSNDITSDMSPLPLSSGTTDPTSPSEDTTLSTTTYDLFENQSIWSLSNADSSTLLSWAQQKSEPPQSKTE